MFGRVRQFPSVLRVRLLLQKFEKSNSQPRTSAIPSGDLTFKLRFAGTSKTISSSKHTEWVTKSQLSQNCPGVKGSNTRVTTSYSMMSPTDSPGTETCFCLASEYIGASCTTGELTSTTASAPAVTTVPSGFSTLRLLTSTPSLAPLYGKVRECQGMPGNASCPTFWNRALCGGPRASESF
jgi:hypothetical protein